MSDFDENKFDREIRSLLDGVEEEVPDRVWNALSERLDRAEAARKRKPVLPWLRYSGIAAAAAAVALGVFFGVREPDFNGQEMQLAAAGQPQSDAVAVTPEPDSSAGTAIQSKDNGRPASDMTYGTPTARGDSTGDLEEDRNVNVAPVGAAGKDIDTMTDTATEMPGEEKPESTDSGQTIKEQIKKYDSDRLTALAWEDDFAEDDRDSRIKTAITVSGLASSNSGAGRNSSGGSRPLMSSGHPGRNSNPISETGNSTNYGIPLSFGLGAKIIFTPRWSLGVGINCSLLSRTFSGTYTTYGADGTPTVTPYSKIRNNQTYIGIPVNAYFSIVKSKAVDFYAYAGGTAEKCVANRYRMGDTGSEIYKEKVEGFQFSANVGLGVEFIVADMLGIYIDPSLRYYFPDSRQPKSIRTVQPLTMGFEMGFRVRL